MRIGGRSSATLILTLATVLAVAAGCSPTSGPLGTPSTPAPTGDASVVPPSGDATPGPGETATLAPTLTPTPAATATGPAASASGVPTGAPAASPTPAQAGTVVVRAYFVLARASGGAGLVPVLRELPATAAVATAAIRQLIAGPNTAELGARPAIASAVPTTTRLLGLTVQNGVAAIDLSSEFTAGFNAASPDERFAQVVYTLTQFSTVHAVVFQLDGQNAGGPFARDTYREAFLPAIFVDRPAWGAAAGNPARVSGVANVFEASFRAQLRDGAGRVLVDQQVMASCGTGCWGDFSATLAYTAGTAQWGTLRVYDLSPKDGAPENITEYPVWLTPAG